MNDYLIYTVTHNDILYTGMMYHENERSWLLDKQYIPLLRDLERFKAQVALSL